MTDGKMYVGVNGVAKRIKYMYAGVNGVVVSMPEMWAGVEGVSRQIFAEIPPLEYITGSSFPNATCFEEYSTQIEVKGGDGEYTYSIYRGSLPRGLTLSPDGFIYGIPEVGGMFGNVTFRVTDSSGMWLNKKIIIRISSKGINFVVQNSYYVYDGRPHTVTVVPSIDIAPDEYTVTVGGMESQINVGTYIVEVKVNKAGYEFGSFDGFHVLNIVPNPNNSISLTSATFAYDGQPHGLIPIVEPQEIQNDYKITYKGNDSTVYEESEQEPVEIGTYTVKAETTNTNYTKRTYTATLTITEG